jgi:arylsulfatase A-like enzyme
MPAGRLPDTTAVRAPGRSPGRGRPSLLFIFTDQQRADSLGAAGNPLAPTPNLDRLAAGGTLFERAYVAQPVCTPSRATLLTGLWPHAHGCIDNNVPLPPRALTLAERLPPDYACAYMGKWHLGDEIIPQHGFDEWVSIEDYYRAHYSRPEYRAQYSTYHHYLLSQGFEPNKEKSGDRLFGREWAARLPEEHTKARFLGREAAAFLRARSGSDRPFILYVNFLEPHRPYSGPLDDLYPPGALPLGPHFHRPPASNAARINRLMAEHYLRGGEIDGEDLTTEAGARKTRAKYLGNVTLVDRAVGDILQALDESGHGQDTIVVFTSDHGDLMGDHGLFEKCVMYEEAVRVPLLIRAPGLDQAPRRVSAPISQIDLVPTLLDLLEQPVPPDLPGVSRAAVVRGQSQLADDVVVEWNGTEWRPPRPFARGLPPEAFDAVRGPWRTLIAPDGWKLNLSPVDQCELYDLNADPYELSNLYAAPEHQSRIAQIAARLRAWQARVADSAQLPVTSYQLH